MKTLKNAGNFKILATWPSEETNIRAQTVLEEAGRTCYQSGKRPITAESAQKFITHCCKRTHYSVIEHGWRGYFITAELNEFLSDMWPIAKFMFITMRDPTTLLVSANLEVWRKALISGKLKKYLGIRYDLSHFAPAIFPKVIPKIITELINDYYFIASEYPIDSEFYLINDEERLSHIAHTVLYDNHSRGFTHELVRHRLPVFSQESTRYIDESDFEVVVPPHRNENDLLEYGFAGENTTYTQAESVKNWLKMNETAYKSLRDDKWRPEDARQILPTAIKAQIVMSCNLRARRYIHFRRTSEFAHWEIRRTMCNELKEFSNKYPTVFSSFEYQDRPAKDGILGFYSCDDSERLCNE